MSDSPGPMNFTFSDGRTDTSISNPGSMNFTFSSDRSDHNLYFLQFIVPHDGTVIFDWNKTTAGLRGAHVGLQIIIAIACIAQFSHILFKSRRSKASSPSLYLLLGGALPTLFLASMMTVGYQFAFKPEKAFERPITSYNIIGAIRLFFWQISDSLLLTSALLYLETVRPTNTTKRAFTWVGLGLHAAMTVASSIAARKSNIHSFMTQWGTPDAFFIIFFTSQTLFGLIGVNTLYTIFTSRPHIRPFLTMFAPALIIRLVFMVVMIISGVFAGFAYHQNAYHALLVVWDIVNGSSIFLMAQVLANHATVDSEAEAPSSEAHYTTRQTNGSQASSAPIVFGVTRPSSEIGYEDEKASLHDSKPVPVILNDTIKKAMLDSHKGQV